MSSPPLEPLDLTLGSVANFENAPTVPTDRHKGEEWCVIAVSGHKWVLGWRSSWLRDLAVSSGMVRADRPRR